MNAPGPTSTRFTHIALATRDLDATLAWYAEWTPLVCLHDRHDPDGRTAWIGHPPDPEMPAHPFVIVLIERGDTFDEVATVLQPLAHFGFEMVDRAAVDEVARRAESAGILHWPATDLGPPVGYICAVFDPDGNVVEFSHDQGVYAVAQASEAPSDRV